MLFDGRLQQPRERHELDVVLADNEIALRRIIANSVLGESKWATMIEIADCEWF